MAIDSFGCNIITGGFNHCDNSWNKTNDELDQCFKIYYPVSGNAIIDVDDTKYIIESGNIYFISGFNIVSQKCNSSMDIYWLHFIPESLYLRYILLESGPFYVWENSEFTFMDDFKNHIKKIFKDYSLKSSGIPVLPYSFEEARLHSFILNFIADILKKYRNNNLSMAGNMAKMKHSIDFMNSEFKSNPSLEEIASKANLAPNYFHRLFKKKFGLTPYNYMLRLRMEIAIRLLTTTSKSVKEIAFEAGYSNEFYFYRQFKKLYSRSPGKLKKMRLF